MAASEGVEEKSTSAEGVFDRIKRNRIISAAIALGTIVIVVSSFTNAAKNLVAGACCSRYSRRLGERSPH